MMDSISAKRSLIKLGQVTTTSEYDFRYFFFGILLMFVCAIFFTLAWAQGYVQQAYSSIGIVFSVVFAALFAAGMCTGLLRLWTYSSAINAVKSGRISIDVFGLFSASDFANDELSVIQEAVRERLWRGINTIEYLASLAFKAGFVGTLWGLGLVFQQVEKITGTESVLQQLPSIGHSFALAFVTTLVGVAVQIPVLQMYRLVRNAAMDLESRIMRTIRDERRKSQ